MANGERENNGTKLASSTDRRAVETRKRFIDAAWELLDETPLAEFLRTIPVERLAERAERSERSFWNHFGDLESFVGALLADVPRLGPEQDEPWIPLDELERDLEGLTRSDLPLVLRTAALHNWTNIQTDDEVTTYLRQVLLVSRLQSQPELRSVIRDRYWGTYTPVLQSIYQTAGRSLGVRPIAPLDWQDYTISLNAFTEGLQLHRMTAPELIDDDKVALAASLVALALVTTEEDPHGLAERAALIAGPVESALSESTELHRRARDAASSWLADTESPREAPTWREVAEATGLSVQDLLECLGRLEVLGSLALGELVSDTALGRPSGSREELLDWMCALVREFRSEPWCARCLLGERLRPDPTDIKTVVDLGATLAAALDEPRDARHDSAVDLLLTCAISNLATTPEAVSEIVLAALPAMGGPATGAP